MLPTFHVHGLFVACHCALLNGSAMFFEPKFDAARAMKLLPQSTVMMGVPTYYVRLLLDPAFGRETCRNMRLFVSGSAPLLKETFDEFKARTGHTILERYGMTEGGMFTSNPYEGERRGGTVGFPLPGTALRIVGAGGTAVKTGEVGSIQVKGDNVFVGYWGMPEKTARNSPPTASSHRRHGQLGRRRLRHHQRPLQGPGDHRRPQCLSEGNRGTDRRHARRGRVRRDRPAASGFRRGRQRRGGAPEESRRQGTERGRHHRRGQGQLANFKVPKWVYLVDELPRNAMGKVQKNILRQEYSR
jgi:malonyl-CoA/methylmalonyl-CoA synthetase